MSLRCDPSSCIPVGSAAPCASAQHHHGVAIGMLLLTAWHCTAFGREKALFPLPRSPPWAAEVPPVVVGLVVLLEPPCLRYTRNAPGYGTSCPGLVLPFCRLLWLTPWPGAAKVDKKPVLETRES